MILISSGLLIFHAHSDELWEIAVSIVNRYEKVLKTSNRQIFLLVGLTMLIFKSIILDNFG